MSHSNTFDSARNLEQFGVKCLTGEACGLGMRVLCDVTEEGMDLLREFTRMEVTCDSWNEKRGIKSGSVMLPRSIFQDLWIFAQVRAGCKHVFLGDWCHEWTTTEYKEIGESHKHPVHTWTPRAWACDDEDMERIERHVGTSFYIERRFTRSSHPGTGLDNCHAMSGRTV